MTARHCRSRQACKGNAVETRWIDALAATSQLAVVGASQREGSFAERIFSALLQQPFTGRLLPINPRHKTVAGLKSYSRLSRIPADTHTALVLTRPDSYDELIQSALKRRLKHLFLIQRQAPTPEQAIKLQQRLQQADAQQLNITVCSSDGLMLPASGCYASPYRQFPPSGHLSILGLREGFCSDALDSLNGLPIGIRFAINLDETFSTPESWLDQLAADDECHCLLLQYPSQISGGFVSALRQAGRRKTVIVHLSQSLNDDEMQLAQHLVERCGCLLSTSLQQQRHALHATLLGKPAASLHILSSSDDGWLHRHAEALGISSKTTPTHRLSRQEGSLAIRDAAAACLQQSDCHSLLLNTHQPAGYEAQLQQLRQTSRKPLYFLAPDAAEPHIFPDAETALQVLAQQQTWQRLQQQRQHFAPPAKSLLAHSSTQPTVRPAGLHYRYQQPYGAQLAAWCGERKLLLLPPFTTLHAIQLAEFFRQPQQQAHYWQCLHTLNLQRPAQQWQLDEQGRLQPTIISQDSLPSAEHDLCLPPPEHTRHEFRSKNGDTLLIRPVQAEDAEALQQFVRALPDQARRTRFMLASKELPAAQLAAYSLIDYRREAGFVACQANGRIVGWAQHSCVHFPHSCEFGISVAAEYQGQGVAKHLMQQLIAFATEQGYQYMCADILSDNGNMLQLARSLGFTLQRSPSDPTLSFAQLPLGAVAPPPVR